MFAAARTFLLTFGIACLVSACGEEMTDLTTDGIDGVNDIGSTAGKADGPFTDCELAQVLVFVNLDTSDVATMKAAGVHTRACNNIFAHRAGDDGVLGTADDRQLHTIGELDDVPYVGKAAFRQLVAHVTPLCASATTGVEVVFSPQPYENSHLTKVVEAINGATTSVDIAMYSFSDSAISAALEAAVERGVSVRMVFESGKKDKSSPAGTKSAKLEEIGVDVRWINKIMHHKYAIVDGPFDSLDRAATGTLITGSANWSRSAATRYDENTVILRGNNEALLRFQREFNLMWEFSRDFVWVESFNWFASATIEESDIEDNANFDAIFTSDNFKTKITSHGPTFSSVSGRNTVSDKLVEMIWAAQSSIHVASGHLRSRPVSEALMAKAQAEPHMDIRVYLDSQEYISKWYHGKQEDKLETCLENAGSSESKQQKCMDTGFLFGYALHDAGIEVRYKYYAYRWHYSYSPQMHNKFIIFDGQTLASGSYNLSDNAEHNTLENVAIYESGAFGDLVQQFESHFETMWVTGRAEGLKDSLIHTIENATDSFPIVFDAMALDWNEVTEVKAAIKANCPAINSEAYRKHPESHMFCDL